MDHHVASVVEMEHDHLEHVSGAIRPEHERAVRRQVVPNVNDGERMFDGMQHVVVLYTVFGRCSVKLHTELMYYETSIPATLPTGRRTAEAALASAGTRNVLGFLPGGGAKDLHGGQKLPSVCTVPRVMQPSTGRVRFPAGNLVSAERARSSCEIRRCAPPDSVGLPGGDFVAWSRVRESNP